MNDLTPPPDEPMPDQSRARIRADLLAATQDGGRSRTSRWVVPGVAAAAVVLVAGMAAWAVQAGGDDDPTGTPAAGASSSAAPSDESTVIATTKPGRVSSSVPPKGAGDVATCQGELANVLPGADQVAAFPDGTSFLVKGDRFVLCDVRAGATTLHKPLPLTPAQDVEAYRVSSLYAPAKGGFTIYRVAGGPVPEGATAFDVRYTFPDGHTEDSTTTTDDQGRTWWRMLTSYHEESGVNEMNLPPIQATVSLSGVQKTYQLAWGLDTCAQANHGC
jgi:hypothetical protein